MAFDLSFSEEFFTGEEQYYEASDRPTNCLQAIASLPKSHIVQIGIELFDMDADFANIWADTEMCSYNILDKLRATDTCTKLLTSPIEVWIDREGYHTILVYDKI